MIESEGRHGSRGPDYRLTDHGREVLVLELRRQQRLVNVAREKGLILDEETLRVYGETYGALLDNLSVTPIQYTMLVALGNDRFHGYGVAQSARKIHRGKALPPSTLYGTLGRLRDGGFITATPTEKQAPQITYIYELTDMGRFVAHRETLFQESLLDYARSRGLLPQL